MISMWGDSVAVIAQTCAAGRSASRRGRVKLFDRSRHILRELYGPSMMSKRVVREWVRLFKCGRTNIHDEERNGWPYIGHRWTGSESRRKSSCKLTFHNLRVFWWISTNFQDCVVRGSDREVRLQEGYYTVRKNAITGWLKAQEGFFNSDGISKLMKRYDKCLNVYRNYVEN